MAFMSIYDNGTQFAWEIWVGLGLAALALFFALRATRKADRRRQARLSHTPPPTAPKRPRPPGDTTTGG